MTTAITTAEEKELAQYESVIQSGLQTFAEVGNALMAIRDARLYRTDHPTFEAYCRDRWGFSRVRAHQLIDASQVMGVLTMVNKPTSERQARPLARLPEDEQAGAHSTRPPILAPLRLRGLRSERFQAGARVSDKGTMAGRLVASGGLWWLNSGDHP